MSLPTWTTSRPSTSNGDAAVPQNNFDVSIDFEKSLVQSCFPVAVSQALRIPVTPSVNKLLPMTSGVAFGPFAISTAYWFFSVVLKCTLKISLRTSDPPRAIVLGGVPLGERVLMWWNYVARTEEETS